MGNNAAFTIFERTIIALHQQGQLTLETLDAIAEPYRGTDIDSGGSQDLTSDGKTVEQICVELVNPEYQDANWDDKFSEITWERWGWR